MVETMASLLEQVRIQILKAKYLNPAFRMQEKQRGIERVTVLGVSFQQLSSLQRALKLTIHVVVKRPALNPMKKLLLFTYWI